MEKYPDRTLGTLVKSMFETYLVPPGYEREVVPGDKTSIQGAFVV